MQRSQHIIVLLTLSLLALAACQADEPKPPMLTPEEQKLAVEAVKLNKEGVLLYQQGMPAPALEKLRHALEIRQKLYPASKYPGGHADLAQNLNNMGFMLDEMGQPGKAMPYYQKSLDMYRKLYPASEYPDGHSELASNLNNVGNLWQAMGQLEQALDLHQQSLNMRRKLFPTSKYPNGHLELAQSLNNLGFVQQAMGQTHEALDSCQQSLAMHRKLYPESKYPDGHPHLAASLHNLGSVLQALGQAEQALCFFQQSRDMYVKLCPATRYPNGHPDVANALGSMGGVLQAMGQAEKALECFQHSLDMQRKLFPSTKFPDGHPRLAASLDDLGYALAAMGQAEQGIKFCLQGLDMTRRLYPPSRFPGGHPSLALSLDRAGTLLHRTSQLARAFDHYEQSLEMRRKLYPISRYPNGHSDLAASLNNLGMALRGMGQTEKALDFYQQSLDMKHKLYPASKYPDGHPDLATSLSNLGIVLEAAGRAADAIDTLQQSLDMRRRLYPTSRYPDGHSYLANSLHNLASALEGTGQVDKALVCYQQAVRIQQKLFQREVVASSESAALNLVAQLRRDTSQGYFSTAVQFPHTETDSYAIAWDEKGSVQRLLRCRHLAASIARHQSAEIRRAFERLGEVQRAIGHLVNNPGTNLSTRDSRLIELGDERDRLTRELAHALPTAKRDEELAALMPRDLVALMPAHAVLIDFMRYRHIGKDKFLGDRYLAFVLAAGMPIRRIELGDAGTIDEAIASWRNSIEGKRENAAPVLLRERIWDKLVPHVPASTKTLYLSPDGDLARLPWAALPLPPSSLAREASGEKRNRVLLEEYAVAVIPHGRFLLEQLKYPPQYPGSESTLTLGNVAYGASVWPALPGTVTELNAVRALAERNSVRPESPGYLSGTDATSAKLTAMLPVARYAHIATHGFFDVESLTAEKKREAEAAKIRALEDDSRIKVATRNPLGYVGLVLTNGEVLTGLSLVDLPLENLELVTLSACETGLGEYTGGEGVQGLQRAFHLAGCPNVVASLWKVNDAATAALMVKFYHELWVNKKPPIEALREAQLTIYRRPDLIPILAAERGIKLEKAIESASTQALPADGARGKTPTKLWAAFVLSGVGK